MAKSTYQKKVSVRYGFRGILYLTYLVICSGIILAADNQQSLNPPQLPPLETFLIEPIELENIGLWVPANKAGPIINRSCILQENCLYFSALPTSVCHEKTASCPDEAARLLAECTAFYHKQSLPLTIADGWRWEYSYNLAQFESATYELPSFGGCWENSREAILIKSTGSVDCLWLRIPDSDKPVEKSNNSGAKSSIEVNTFTCVRTRDGYPKERKL